MRTRVFVSCGQRQEEKNITLAIGDLLRRRGFEAYVAIDAQTILEINRGIIGELRNSDCYLFVNFRRDPVGHEYPGSLFSNQELAIAYAMGFERILVVNQSGAPREGMLGYIGINTETFEDLNDCCAVVERAIDRSGWAPGYSRRLTAGNLRFGDKLIRYNDLIGRFLYVDIKNGRPDTAAMEATARLSEFGPKGGPSQPCPIRSPLKATARQGFSHTIFPKSHEAFDLLCVGTQINEVSSNAPVVRNVTLTIAPTLPPFRVSSRDVGVYLNSAEDVLGADRLNMIPGVWWLKYEFYAIGFPLLSLQIELAFTNLDTCTAEIISQEVA
jgi:hypothetical protein